MAQDLFHRILQSLPAPEQAQLLRVPEQMRDFTPEVGGLKIVKRTPIQGTLFGRREPPPESIVVPPEDELLSTRMWLDRVEQDLGPAGAARQRNLPLGLKALRNLETARQQTPEGLSSFERYMSVMNPEYTLQELWRNKNRFDF